MTTQEVTVELTEQDGNVFSIIGRVSKALNRAGFRSEAEEYAKKALACKSYDEVLRLTMETVDVE